VFYKGFLTGLSSRKGILRTVLKGFNPSNSRFSYRMILFATFWLPKVAIFGNPVTSQSQHFFESRFYGTIYGLRKRVQLFPFLVAKVASLFPLGPRVFHKLFKNYAHKNFRGRKVFESII
jgi:hypothetical protein